MAALKCLNCGAEPRRRGGYICQACLDRFEGPVPSTEELLDTAANVLGGMEEALSFHLSNDSDDGCRHCQAIRRGQAMQDAIASMWLEGSARPD